MNPARDLLTRAAEKLSLSARGYHRVLKVARTIADLADEPHVRRQHLAGALSYRREPEAAANTPAPGALAPVHGLSDVDDAPKWLSLIRMCVWLSFVNSREACNNFRVRHISFGKF